MMMKKRIQFILALGISLSFFNGFLNAALEEIEKTSVFTPSRLAKIALFHDEEGFHVLKDGEKYQVKNHLLDRSLRNISKDSSKLKRFLKNGYIVVNQAENSDEYLLETRDRLKGGGAFGAWLGSTLGYGLVSFAGHGIILGVSLFAGPAQPAAFYTLEKMFAIPIHSAACAGGVAGGITLAVATGPV